MYKCVYCGYLSPVKESPCPQCVSFESMHPLNEVRRPRLQCRNKAAEAWCLVTGILALLFTLSAIVISFTTFGMIISIMISILVIICIAISRALNRLSYRRTDYPSKVITLGTAFTVISAATLIIFYMIVLGEMYGFASFWGYINNSILHPGS